MKFISVIVMLAVSLSMIPVVNAYPHPETAKPSIIELDVCNSSGSAIQISLDMPFICERLCTHVPIKFIGLHETPSSALEPLLIAFREDRPPEF